MALYPSTPILAALIVAGMIIPTAASAEALSLSYSYFTIGGATPMDIEAEMGRFGPEIKGSEYRHPGATRMEFSSRIGYRQDQNKCRIVSAQVSIKAKVILPRWKRPRNADAAARLFWDVLSADIVRHEESHLVIGRNHARSLERQLKKLPAQKDCDKLAEQAEVLKEKIMAEHDREQQRFDAIEGKNLEKRLVGKLKRRIEK
ncbi:MULTISPECIES: DUF922 domain-containing Zn-dependent protease [Mesorhizobium]|uniref:DUF922 domain-containing protein n=1 Tax=Mesorhizobium denitrificans TaxID=2294114 RepID=A0A371XBM7_9HYPH|nr:MULTISPECIES: DUF922 domain-containing protein [Mesorhizobium]RFC66633.1 DUF922 domain-containing protein [Mesorhizobium denitrificans]